MAKKSKGYGDRNLRERVKTAKGRKLSSTLWLERQLNDPYVKRAKADGYRSRAAYKLLEINEKHKILKKGQRIVDLGAAPGGWTQIAADITGSSAEHPLVAAIDYLDVDPVPGAVIFKKDFLDEDAPGLLRDTLGGDVDVVLSDMAAPTTGNRRTDHLRTMHLCEVAADFAINNLKIGGHFLSKTFQGGTEGDLLTMLKRHFKTVAHVKPPASRAGSVELYVLAKEFRR